MAKKYNICLDIGGTKVLGAVFNEKDKLVCKIKRRSTEQGNSTENIESVIIAVTRALLQKAGIKKSQLNAISAGVPGIINSKTGIVVFTPNLPWRDYDLRAAIEKEFNAKFYLGNDVNVGVLGEYDALSGLGQEANCLEKKPNGKNAGQGCGHNLLGVGSLAAAIAVKKYL